MKNILLIWECVVLNSNSHSFCQVQVLYQFFALLYSHVAAKVRLEGLIHNLEQPWQLTPGGQASLAKCAAAPEQLGSV